MEINRLIAALGTSGPKEIVIPVYDTTNYHVGDLKFYQGDNTAFELYINGYYLAQDLPLHVNEPIPFAGWYLSSDVKVKLNIIGNEIHLIGGTLSVYTQYGFYKSVTNHLNNSSRDPVGSLEYYMGNPSVFQITTYLTDFVIEYPLTSYEPLPLYGVYSTMDENNRVVNIENNIINYVSGPTTLSRGRTIIFYKQ